MQVLDRARAAAGETFRSLEHRDFRLYFWTQSVSISGSWVQMVAQTLLALRLSDSGTVLGLLTAMQFGPALLFGAWAGVAVDRFDRRRLMELASVAMLVVSAVLGVLVVVDRAGLPVLFACAGIVGLVNVFDNTARRVLVSDLVPASSLGNAVSLNATVVTAARLVGPAMAGILATTVGIGWCFLLNAVTFVAPLFALRRMDPSIWSVHTRAPARRGALRGGVRYAWETPAVRIPLLLTAVVGAFGFNSQVVLPLLAKRELGGGEGTFTVLAVAGSLGMLVGSLWLARRQTITARLVAVAALVFGATNALLGVAPNVPSAVVASWLVGVAAAAILAGANTVVQLVAPVALRSRVIALFNVVFLGSTPIGGPIVGVVAERAGTRAAIAVGAVTAAVGGAAALAFLAERSAVAEAAPEATV